MPTGFLVALLGVAVLVNLALVGAVLVSSIVRRRSLPPDDASVGTMPPEPIDIALQAAAQAEGSTPSRAGISAATYDRVVRIVSYGFLIGTAIIVALGGLWATSAPAIYALLAGGAIVVFVVHEILPSSRLGGALLVFEAVTAIALFTVLIALTGGVDSPFFFGYYLIAAAAALVVGGAANFLLAAAISAVYLLALLLVQGATPLEFPQIVRLGFNLMALWLLSYLASVVAREQRRTRDAAVRLSLHDPLTRLYNRNYLFAVMDREIARAGRTKRRFSLLMLDLDGLKPINDRYGHYFGDRMLREVAEVVRRGIRVIDSAARYGGDEFVVLLPETDPSGALVVAEKMRRAIAGIRVLAGADVLRTTVSVGVVAFPDDGRTADALLNRADQAMYESKRTGKDRVWAGVAGADRRTAAGLPIRPGTRVAVPVNAAGRRAVDQPAADRRAADRRMLDRRGPAPPDPDTGRQAADDGPSAATAVAAAAPAAAKPAARQGKPKGSAAAPDPTAAATSGRTGVPRAKASRGPRRFVVLHHTDPRFERTMRDFIRGPRPLESIDEDRPEADERPA